MEIARQSIIQGDVSHVVQVLSRYIPKDAKEDDLRGFVWHLWWASSQRYSAILDHGANVVAIDFSADERSLVTAGTDQKLRLWDLASGDVTRVFEAGRMNRGSDLSLSSDGRWLAATCDEDFIQVWDLHDPKRERMTISGGAVDVQFRDHDRQLVCVNRDGTFRVINSETWDLAASGGRGTPLGTSCLPPESNLMVVANRRGTIFVTQIDADQVKQFPAQKVERIWSLAVSPDLKTIAAGGMHEIRLIDSARGHLKQTLTSHIGPVGSLTFSPDGHSLASAGNDGRVKIWNLDRNELTVSHPDHARFVSNGKILFSRSGRQIASASSDGTVKVWRYTGEEPKDRLTDHQGRIESVSFSHDSRTLVSCSQDRSIRLWDVATGESQRTFHAHSGPVFDAACSPDGTLLASCGDDQTVRLWDMKSGETTRLLRGHNKEVFSVAFSPDGKTVASGGVDRTVRVWSAESGKLLQTLDQHEGGVRAVEYVANERIASASIDGRVRVWNWQSGELIQTLSGHTGGVRCLSVSADRRLLASGSEDRTVKIWDLSTGKLTRTLGGLGGIVNSVDLCADGTTLATGGYDRIVRLWDLRTGEIKSYLDYRGSAKQILSVAFSPDGQTLATGNLDSSIRVWRAGPGYEAASAKQ